MELIPAIDLLDGMAVRLVQGDYGRRAASVGDPVRLIRDWLRAGVRWLHLVDLDGARTGRPVHLELVRTLAAAARASAPEVRLELGGGLRTIEDIDAAFDAGIDVAILGTAAIEDRRLFAASAARWPGRIALAIDVRGRRLAVAGWTRTMAADPVDVARAAARDGVAQVIVTDVERDGTRRGPNRELLARLRDALPDARLVAAGGISSVDDLRALTELAIDGAVVGLALVDGSLPVSDALAAVTTEVA